MASTARTIDIISPTYLQQDKIALSLSTATTPALANRPVTVNINYAAAGTTGISLPLQLLVQPAFGDGEGFIERLFRRVRPTSFTWSPLGAGRHLVVLREIGHNRWQGRLVITVEGDEFATVLTERS